MLDFIKSLNLSDELNTNEIYNLFKTDSSDLNLKFLSVLQRFHTTNEFLNYYTKQNCQNAFDFFNNLSSLSSTIYEEEDNNILNSQIDKYLSDISKIILLFSLIQKNNELLSNLLTNTKKLLKRFYDDNHSKSILKERINNCINDLMNSSQITSQRNYSRRSTKENTILGSSIFNGKNIIKSKFENNSNDGEEYLLFQCHTPKFEEEDNEIIEVLEEQSNYNNLNLDNNDEIKEENIKIDSKNTISSSLTLKHMKFIYDSDQESSRAIKKNKTIKMGLGNLEPTDFLNKKSNSSKINDNSYNEEKDNNEHILVQFLNNINSLFRNGNISSDEKFLIKQSLISDTGSIMKRFNEYKISNKHLKSNNNIYIKKFLIEQIQYLKFKQ